MTPPAPLFLLSTLPHNAQWDSDGELLAVLPTLCNTVREELEEEIMWGRLGCARTLATP